MQPCTNYYDVADYNARQPAFAAKVFCDYTIYGRKRDVLAQAFIDWYGTVQFRVQRSHLMRGHKAFDANPPLNPRYDCIQWGGVPPRHAFPTRTRLAQDLHAWCNEVLTNHQQNKGA